MSGKWLKLLTVGMSVVALAIGGIALSRFWAMYDEVQAAAMPLTTVGEAHGENHALAGHEVSSGHGAEAAKPSEGHGEAPSGHGETAPAHGEPSGHGETTAPARHTASVAAAPLISIEEVISNINSSSDENSHLLGLKLELELFDDIARPALEQHQAGIRNAILITSMEQTYEKLSTIAGKLYFKELLVSRLNEFFKQPLIRDIHFSSFYLQ